MEQLTEQQDASIRAWMARGELNLLKSVVDGQVKHHQAKALSDAMGANSGNLKLDAANASLLRAQRYQDFLDVLNELMNQRDRYEVAKLA